jgi:hypothetical protein
MAQYPVQTLNIYKIVNYSKQLEMPFPGSVLRTPNNSHELTSMPNAYIKYAHASGNRVLPDLLKTLILYIFIIIKSS